jgi:hypothetical protein
VHAFYPDASEGSEFAELSVRQRALSADNKLRPSAAAARGSRQR